MLAESPLPSLTDEALVDLARRGVDSAFAELVARYRDRILRVAMRMCRNESDAEEIAQESFLRAHRALGSFHGEAAFATWLHRIAVNEALMRKRAARRRPTESLDALASDGPDAGARGAAPPAPGIPADDLLERKREAEQVYVLLGKLDGDARATLVMRHLDELSTEEVSQILGVTPHAVRQRARRARLRLRSLFHANRPTPRGALPVPSARG